MSETKHNRPPVVAIMGHIDHGKSTLLDYIRNTRIVDKEAGGITQHISAYEYFHKKEDSSISKITFLDTPGHEAFQGIRARGAALADIAVLIVSAEDGVKPQTIEARNKIIEAKLPYIVAITKIDKPGTDIERTKQSLAENDIYVEGYGGNISVVPVSAKTGAGVTELLDMILLIAELEDFGGHPERLGTGIIIESRLDPKKGITSVAVITDGTVEKGNVAATTGAIAPLRFILDADGKQVDSLTFSSPIQIIGWDNLPPVGAYFEIFEDKPAAQLYADSEKLKKTSGKREVEIREDISALPLIVKADAAGSLEATLYELSKLSRERIIPRIILSAVGVVGEVDVKAAMTTPGTIILAFHTKVDSQAASVAERSGVVIKEFDIIYKLAEYVESLLEEREPRIEVEEVVGAAKILKLFSSTKDKQVMGARVTTGTIEKNASVRIMRRDAEIGRGKIRELQQSKMETTSVKEGDEFGTMIESKIELCPGDIIECIVLVTK